MRHFLFTSLLLLCSASVMAQADTSAYRDLSQHATSAVSVSKGEAIAADRVVKDSTRLITKSKPGYYVSYGTNTADSLTILLDDWSEEELWREGNWSWMIRENSSIGGIQYNSLAPMIHSDMDGWHKLSRSYRSMPNYHIASAPRTDMTALSGIGGGQLVGVRTMSPVDSSKQLWVDYLRSNALGLYRNEGTDGHELNVKMRQQSMGPAYGFEFSYFNARSGQNGGLSSPALFEANVPSLRRNFSVKDSRGELFEENLKLMVYRHFEDLTVKALVSHKSWSAQNSIQKTEYFWDSTATTPSLLNRNLYYGDSLSLSTAQLSAEYHKALHKSKSHGYFAIAAHSGLEWLSSNAEGYDVYRVDSIHETEAFDASLMPYLRLEGTLALQSDELVSYRGSFKLNALGFNAGSYDVKNAVKVLAAPGELVFGVNLLYQPHMYRFEQLYGYPYDFRDVEVPYVRNEAKADWKFGSSWKKELAVYGAQISGMRYLESFDDLATWDGLYTRAQFGLTSDRLGWNVSVQGYGAYKSSFGGFATPNWGGYGDLHYRTSIGARFQLKTGLNISVEDAFYTPTYLVGVPIWAIQTEYLAGSYPWATAYFEARIANFIGAIRVINALEGVAPYTYYAFGSTPRSDRWIQLSARWTLFN